MEIIPDKRKLVSLIEQAHEGKLCLPNFQRDFVWRRGEVADLLRSVVRRYFIGSLLLLRCDPNKPPFAPAFLRGARPLHREPHPELLVLDGQQRLTAVLYALTAPSLSLKDSTQRRWFYLDLNLLLREPLNDEIVFDRSARELDGLDHRETQYAQRILPFTAMLTSKDFLNWRDGIDDWLREHDQTGHTQYREVWRDQWTNTVTGFQNFEVPLVELPRVEESDHEAIGRVCAIFEKLNSTGIELSVYDLLTARLYRHGIRLHELWRDACADHPRLREWSGGKADTNKFGVLILRTLALLRGTDPTSSALINLDPQGFEHDWRRAARAMERALEIVTMVGPDGFGVFDRKWLPGFALLPVIAALRAVIDDQKLGEGPRQDLRRWYWCNVFLERYSSAVESKSRKDYQELVAHWRDGRPEPAVFGEARARIGANTYTIRDSASYASAVYSGVFCLLALRGARDWRRGEAIQLQALQDHHIFPQAYLKRHGVTLRARVNSIANRTLISDETNTRVRDKAPADYLADVGIFPHGPEPELTAPHFLTKEALDAMRLSLETSSQDEVADMYGYFLAEREAAIIAEIRRVCGVAVGENEAAQGSTVSN